MMDFSNLKYRVDEVPLNELVTEYIPELNEYVEFSNPKHDKLVRIAVLATDEGSPFLKKERDDYEKRLRSIFEYLKIKDDKLLKQLIINDNVTYAQIINRFFIICDNLAYVMWNNMLFNFHMIGFALRQPPDNDDLLKDMEKRSILQKKQKEIHEDLVTFEAKIFPDAATRKVIRKEVAKILQFPEQFAREKGVF
jgi:hypothetical protein